MADLDDFQGVLGVVFNEPSLLEQALVHSSYINENPGSIAGHNERLEYLGDAVLGFIVADKLYQEYPDLSEGEMTRLRSALVRRETLARAAESIRLGDFLYLGKGEEAGGGRGKTANLAGALEAVIAAIYLDQGVDAARKFILDLLGRDLAGVTGKNISADYKSRLQEVVQSSHQTPPAYRVIEEAGPDHDKWYTVEVMVGEKVLGAGSGKSKKLAEVEAARVALELLATRDND